MGNPHVIKSGASAESRDSFKTFVGGGRRYPYVRSVYFSHQREVRGITCSLDSQTGHQTWGFGGDRIGIFGRKMLSSWNGY